MDKSRVLSNQVKQNDVFDFEAVPVGKSWIIDKIGGTDSNKSAAPSSFKLLWGYGQNYELIRHLAVTTGTVQIELKKELIGDGQNHLRLVRESSDQKFKDMPFWIDCYER